MLVAIPFCAADQPHAERLLDWIGEIGSYPNHDLILFRELRAAPVITKNRTSGFRTVQEIQFQDPYQKWPISTTNAFQTVARHIEYNSKEPFLFLEPDCIVMTSDWLDEIEKEYRRAKRPFMGAYVPQHGDVPEHLSGVSVYPGEVINYAGQALMLDDTAPWDTAVGNAIVRQAHCTDLIQHHWRHPGFKSMEEVRSRITSECRLWHSDKSGSLIELLRKERLVSEIGKTMAKNIAEQKVNEAWGGTPEDTLQAFREFASLDKPHSGKPEKDSTPNGEPPRNLYGMSDVKRQVQMLGIYANKDGFAKARVVNQLIIAGLIPRKPKKKGKRK